MKTQLLTRSLNPESPLPVAERGTRFVITLSGLKAVLLYVLAAVLLVSSPAHADSNKKSADSKKSQKQLKEEKEAKRKAAVESAVVAHLTYLKPFLPRVTPAEIKGRNIADLRRLYYDAYRIQGLSLEEARTKAEEEITPQRAEEVSMISSAPGKNKKNQVSKATKTDFEFLSVYLPNLQLSDLERRNDEDLRRFYYEAYRAQGIGMVEAQQRADELDFSSDGKKKIAKPAETPEEPPVVDTNFEYLSSFLPKLTPADLRDKSDADLKRLYYEAYLAQGMSVQEAKQTADRLVVVKLASGDDPYSLEPGQIASSTKTTVKQKPEPTPKK